MTRESWPYLLMDPHEHPMQSILYIGYKILHHLEAKQETTFEEILELFGGVNSSRRLILATDWLFLARAIEVDNDGTITRRVIDTAAA